MGLKPNGLIGIKENTTRLKDKLDFDEVDSSVIRSYSLIYCLWIRINDKCNRSDDMMKLIFISAGLVVIKEALQTNFPKGLYPVKMYLNLW